ncbi:MAG: GNAT family N-acetyltransferase [Rhizobiales bacterium]|nr:GNAT family N-acetyltransferase [Hyphomicrobiales bacterium]
MTCIATERLLLRPIGPPDLLPIARHINNLAVAQNLTRVVHPYYPDDFHRWEQRDKRHAHVFGITLKGAIIGVVGLESDAVGSEAELGYWLAEAYWNQGLMSEAARAATDFGLGRAGYDRLVSGYRHGNEASRRILIGLGFRHTGHKSAWSFALKRPVAIATVELTRREGLRERARK